MRKIWFMLIGIVFVLTPSVIQAEQKVLLGTTLREQHPARAAQGVIHAEQKAPLGTGNFSLKLDYITFTDDWGDEDVNGMYVGLEGYGQIAPNLYLGGEIGAGSADVGITDLTFHPIELNLKYAKEFVPNLIADFGAGVSYSYASLEIDDFWGLFMEEETVNDWLFGGQVFADLTFHIQWFSFGVNAKYQITEDFKDADVSLSNLRLGAQLGVLF